MPCFRCGTRQTDPDQGPSPWRRAVRAGRQVLVCPDCQDGGSWHDAVESCPKCGSVALARRLGQTVCTQCLALVHETPTVDTDAADLITIDAALSRDVADAIERTLGRA